MSTQYTGPGVEVTVQENKRLINLAEDARVPAIVGMGPTRLRVTETIARGSASYIDTLSHISGVLIELIATVPGALATDDTVFSNAGVDYTDNHDGTITWESDAAAPDGTTMVAGLTYYVTYSYLVDSTQYNPKLFYDDADIINQYGPETDGIDTETFGPTGSTITSPICGNLTVAGRLALQNGAPSVYLCQASGSVYNLANYRAAIDKLEKLVNVGKVVVVFPRLGVSQTDINSVHSYVKAHCEKMSAVTNKREREGIIGDAFTTFASAGGHDTIGDSTTNPSFIYKKQSYSNKRTMIVAPSEVLRTSDKGVALVLDGNYAAAAVAGAILGQNIVSRPITGKQLIGFTIPNEQWTESELNTLGANGITVLTSMSNVVTVRHALTTDTSTPETVEDSVVQIENAVKRTVRNKLRDTFIGKGLTVSDDTLYSIGAVTRSTLERLITSEVIQAYGKINNPITGETPITVKQSSVDPRIADVTFTYKPLYPLVWIKVTASTYV